MDLWQTRTITMDDGARKAARSDLEWRLCNESIADCVGVFRQVLQGREEELFQRSLLMFAAVEREEHDDQLCIEEAMQKLARKQHVPNRKRKHEQDLEAAIEENCCAQGAKCARQGLPDLERLAVLMGLAGISQARVMELGDELYCERQRRAHIVAQRYAMQYVKAKIPHVHMRDLLQFFYHLLGDMVFEILQEDLHMHADAVFMLMCWWTCRMDDTLASEGELVSVQVF